MTAYYISLPAMTFALEATAGQVTRTPPIARWCAGKSLSWVLGYWRKRGAMVQQMAVRA